MVSISKSDWKRFREKIPEWQEHYMECLIKEYIEMLSSPGKKRIKIDKKHPGVMIELNKSEAIWDIAILVKKKVITMKDLEGYSQELIESVVWLLNR